MVVKSASLIDNVDAVGFTVTKRKRRNYALVRVAYNQHRLKVRQELEGIEDFDSPCVVSMSVYVVLVTDFISYNRP